MGDPKCDQPTLFLGRGSIKLGTNVSIGLINSKQYYSTYTYFEARKPNAEIVIGNNFFLITVVLLYMKVHLLILVMIF